MALHQEGMPARDPRVAPDRVGFLENLAYGCGDLSSNLLWGISGSFLMYYYTDVYRLPAGQVAALLLVVRILDALIDPLIGYAIDLSHGRLVRPLIRWLALPFGAVAFLAFVPLPGSDGVRLAWAYATYLAFGSVYAGINTPYGALGNMTAVTPHARVVQGAFRMVGCQSGQLLIAILTVPGVHWLGGGQDVVAERAGFPRYMALVALLGTALWGVTYKVCRIRIRPPPLRHSVVQRLVALRRNRPWIIACLGCVLHFVNLCAYASFAVYYARDVLHRETVFGGTLLTVMTIAGIAGAVCTSGAARWIGRRRALMAALATEACALFVVGLRPDDVSVVMPALTVAWLAVGLCSPFYFSMISDAIDYGAARTGVRSAGMAYGINSLIVKIAFAVTGSLLAMFLAWGHYDPTLARQPAFVARYVTAGYVWLPALSSMLAIAVMALYPSDQQIQGVTQGAAGREGRR
jgi:glycoside/pentoside/hexuronide:cation symporter, GPH family